MQIVKGQLALDADAASLASASYCKTRHVAKSCQHMHEHVDKLVCNQDYYSTAFCSFMDIEGYPIDRQCV